MYLKEQVPNCDNQFLEYIAQIYIEDERFVKFINKQRERGLNLYISDAIKTFIKL
ncbi:TipAS antibiotic-recognition domain protein [Staphylococcus epidermidis VCU036]|nr:TipAS antibiotic-recognition domain protein [Staphylococcus epidermidis VCU036]